MGTNCPLPKNEVANRIASLSGYARPNLVGNPIPSKQTAQLWFDPNAFAVPVGSYGNLGRNVLRSSSVRNMDFSVFKGIRVGESKELQLRLEAFNVLNIQNLAVPSVTTINATAAANASAGVGRITGIVGNPRQVQIGARFRF